jgi:hypothetical protein
VKKLFVVQWSIVACHRWLRFAQFFLTDAAPKAHPKKQTPTDEGATNLHASNVCTIVSGIASGEIFQFPDFLAFAGCPKYIRQSKVEA